MTAETSPGGDRDWKGRLSSRLVRRPEAGWGGDRDRHSADPAGADGAGSGLDSSEGAVGEARLKERGSLAGSGEKVLTGVGAGDRKDPGGGKEEGRIRELEGSRDEIEGWRK